MNFPRTRTRPVARISHAAKDEIKIVLDAHHGVDYVLITARSEGPGDEPWGRKLGNLAIRANEIRQVIVGLQQALDELES